MNNEDQTEIVIQDLVQNSTFEQPELAAAEATQIISIVDLVTDVE